MHCYAKIAEYLSFYIPAVCIFAAVIALLDFIAGKNALLYNPDFPINKVQSKVLNRSLLIAALISLFFLKLPVLDLPAYWDEEFYIRNVSKILTNHFNPFIDLWRQPPYFSFLSLPAAFIYKIFNHSLISLRFITLIFSFLAVYFTFLLGKKLYDDETGLFAALLLSFSPLFFSQSGLFLADMAVTALGLITVYLFLKNNRPGYFISGIFLILTKDASVLIIIGVVIYEFFLSSAGLMRRDTAALRRILFASSPLLPFFVWALCDRSFLSVLLGYCRAFSPDVSSASFYKGMGLANMVFFVHFKFLIAAAVIFCAITKKGFLKKEILLFTILIFITVFFYSAMFRRGFPPLVRYFLYLQPFFFIFGASAISGLFKNKPAYIMCLGIIICLFIYSWNMDDSKYSKESNLSYLSLVKVHRQAAAFLAERLPSALIIADWPVNSQLQKPELGYVASPMRHVHTFRDLYLYFNFFPLDEKMVFVIAGDNVKWHIDIMKSAAFKQNKNLRLLARFRSKLESVSVYGAI